MRLRTCRNIEIAFRTAAAVLLFPFRVVAMVGAVLSFPWRYLSDLANYAACAVSNRMLRNCDEVKEGEIRNMDIIRSWTSWEAYVKFMAEKKECGR